MGVSGGDSTAFSFPFALDIMIVLGFSSGRDGGDDEKLMSSSPDPAGNFGP